MDIRSTKTVNNALKKSLRKSSGEILIEVVVSFVVVLILLAGITAIINTSTKMNNRAETTNQEMEAAIDNIEAGEVGAGATEGTMEITFPGRLPVEMDISVAKEGAITYFVPKDEGI